MENSPTDVTIETSKDPGPHSGLAVYPQSAVVVPQSVRPRPAAVTMETSRDPIYRMRVYQLAVQVLEEAWPDVQELSQHPMMLKVCDQLYSAVGSIEANIADGYSRSSGKDRSRFYEYALSSTRESVTWYRAGRPILGSEITTARWNKLEEIRRLLLVIIPQERGRQIRPRTSLPNTQ